MQSPPSLTLPPVFLRSHGLSSDKASLSRNLHAVAPSLVHTLSQEENSILSVATGDDHVYSGSQNQSISVRLSLPHFSCARALTQLTYRSGTFAPTPSRHNLEVTRVAYSLSNTRRINTGYLARQVCSVSIPRYPQITELGTGDSSVRVCNSASPARFPLTLRTGVGYKAAYPALRYQSLPRHRLGGPLLPRLVSHSFYDLRRMPKHLSTVVQLPRLDQHTITTIIWHIDPAACT
jgi:hypothetical protein